MGNRRLESRERSNSLPRKVGIDAEDEDHPVFHKPYDAPGISGRSTSSWFPFAQLMARDCGPLVSITTERGASE